jgi:hypothetical protein
VSPNRECAHCSTSLATDAVGEACEACLKLQPAREVARRSAREGRGAPQGPPLGGSLIGVACLVGLATILLEALPVGEVSRTTRVLLAFGLAGVVGAGLMLRTRAALLRAKRERPALAALRYEHAPAPTDTRCGFCHAGFTPGEEAWRCKGCGSLVHGECGADLVETPGPLCPTYACEG